MTTSYGPSSRADSPRARVCSRDARSPTTTAAAPGTASSASSALALSRVWSTTRWSRPTSVWAVSLPIPADDPVTKILAMVFPPRLVAAVVVQLEFGDGGEVVVAARRSHDPGPVAGRLTEPEGVGLGRPGGGVVGV